MNDMDMLDLLLDGKELPEDEQGTEGTEQDADDDTSTEDDQSVGTDGGDQSSGAEGDGTGEGEGGEGDPDPAKEAEAKARKQEAAAFAKLRVENSKLNKAVASLTKALNIEGATLDEQIAALTELATKRLAKEQGIPAEILQKLNALEEETQATRAARNEAVLLENLTSLKTSKGLSDEAFDAFIEHLDSTGLSSRLFEDPNSVDLDYVYYKLHGTQDIEQRIKSEVEKAIKDFAAAGNKSTTPGKANGKPGSTETNISTVKDLDSFLDSLDKK